MINIKDAAIAAIAAIITITALWFALRADSRRLDKERYTVTTASGDVFYHLKPTFFRNRFLTTNGRFIMFNGSYVATQEGNAE